MSKKKSILMGGIFAVIAVLLFLPVMVVAGSLEPSAAPAPTMRTLEEVTPTWSKKLTCAVGNCPRFVVLADFNNAAVLDKETGLVWEKSPDTPTYDYDWYGAIYQCNNKSLGGRKGWRLPTVEELASLVDPTQSSPALPSGHPFTNVQSSYYWSATTAAALTTVASVVNFTIGYVSGYDKTYGRPVWCVRGGHGYDAY